MTGADPDRLRELLDAVLADDHTDLDGMARGAFASPFHFSRQVRTNAGESPVALRRRVLLERAAWSLQHGMSVTDAAFAAGYESVDGFARAFTRAFGHSPSRLGPSGEHSHWLPAPNGIHFHSPTTLYIDAGAPVTEDAGDVVMMMVRHDIDDTAAVLDNAKAVDPQEYRRTVLTDQRVSEFTGAEESLSRVLVQLVNAKQPWLSAITGTDPPPPAGDGIADLIEAHARVAPQWLALVRDIDRRGAWADRIVDALCRPPETFLLSEILTHVLTFGAYRRQLARHLLRRAGADLTGLDPDPIIWHRKQSGGF
ncbi:helix-turn-helix transcriptional regulator [Gordonia sp. ABSL1-1]|uniref:helix-turn-helix transcriptional regulator n=1 Tax=Gordonia sp. ABSL1-1 TaxID=3053923 RepID=UPI0025745466|nr:helix-turn-helix transcriptional regulator [Gordonia sp. ABSL1-1]MDL9938805.1 helix-turn-helix transcriptional regulator [Gordonia sp. ABSL1-1]